MLGPLAPLNLKYLLNVLNYITDDKIISIICIKFKIFTKFIKLYI